MKALGIVPSGASEQAHQLSEKTRHRIDGGDDPHPSRIKNAEASFISVKLE